MAFGIGSLKFIDDAVDSVMGGLDDLFSNKEERQKARNELQKLKNNLKAQTQGHVEKMAKIYAEDRQQARSVQQKALDKAWWLMPTLAILSFAGFFAILFTLIFTEITVAKQPLYIMLGTLGTIVTQQAHFFFGSSKGSKDKSEDIRRTLADYKPPARSTTEGDSEQGAKASKEVTRKVSTAELERTPPKVQAKPPSW